MQVLTPQIHTHTPQRESTHTLSHTQREHTLTLTHRESTHTHIHREHKHTHTQRAHTHSHIHSTLSGPLIYLGPDKDDSVYLSIALPPGKDYEEGSVGC